MAYDDFNQFQKMEDPEERQAQDLRRREKSKAGFQKKPKASKSVSLKTFKVSTGLVTALVWLAFIVAVGYAIYWLVGLFPTN